MLRITVEIVPHGIEEAAKTIGTLEIGNFGTQHDYGFGHKVCGYRYRTWEADEDCPGWSDQVVLHDRRDGAWRLIQRVLGRLIGTSQPISEAVQEANEDQTTPA